MQKEEVKKENQEAVKTAPVLSAAISKKYKITPGYAVKFVTDRLGAKNQDVDLSTASLETAETLMKNGYKGLTELKNEKPPEPKAEAKGDTGKDDKK